MLGACTFAGPFAGGCQSSLDLGREALAVDGSPGSEADGGDGSDGGPGEASCSAACAKLGACGYLDDPDAAEECRTGCPALSSGLLDCVMDRSCAEVPECGAHLGGVADAGTSGDDDFEVKVCQSRCDSAKFFSCLDASEHAECRSRCATKPADVRDTYEACASSAGSRCPDHRDCYAQFGK